MPCAPATTTTRSGLELWHEAGSTCWMKFHPVGWPARSGASRTWAYTSVEGDAGAGQEPPQRGCLELRQRKQLRVNNQAEFDYAKANDPTRLAYIRRRTWGESPERL